jgi:SAM-dependent methyltransferase
MSGKPYFAANFDRALERERLACLEAALDPTSTRHLSDLGVHEGWRCLEVGGGGGSLVRWLAGRGAQVVAVDIDTTYLDRIDLPNVVVRRCDVVVDELERGGFDLAHCRLLLMHLAEPERVLQKMMAALRPGGWLCVEEWSVDDPVCDPAHPSAEDALRLLRKMSQCYASTGINIGFGCDLPWLVQRLGLEDVRGEAVSTFASGAHPVRRMGSLGVKLLRERLVTSGFENDEEIDALLAILEDRSLLSRSASLVSVWGRKPL